MTDDFFNSRHIAALHGVSLETVRVWSDEFEKYLSPTANPGKNRHRQFTNDDLQVFALVSEMKARGLAFSDIHAALSSGQRGSAPDITPEEIQALMMTDGEKRLLVEMEFLQRNVAKYQQERDEALKQVEGLLEEVRAKTQENIQLQAQREYTETRIKELMERLNNAEERITGLVDERSTLREELGEAKGELKAMLRMLQMRGSFPSNKDSD